MQDPDEASGVVEDGHVVDAVLEGPGEDIDRRVAPAGDDDRCAVDELAEAGGGAVSRSARVTSPRQRPSSSTTG